MQRARAAAGGAVRLDRAGVVDADGADVAHASEVVAHEVDDHGEFGGVLLAGREGVRAVAGGARAFDGARDGAASARVEVDE